MRPPFVCVLERPSAQPRCRRLYHDFPKVNLHKLLFHDRILTGKCTQAYTFTHYTPLISKHIPSTIHLYTGASLSHTHTLSPSLSSSSHAQIPLPHIKKYPPLHRGASSLFSRSCRLSRFPRAPAVSPPQTSVLSTAAQSSHYASPQV